MSRPRSPTTTNTEAKPAMRIETRHGRSIGMRLLQGTIKPLKPHLSSVSKTWPAGSPKLDVPKHMYEYCSVTERMVEDVYVYDLIGLNSPLQQQPKGNASENGSRPSGNGSKPSVLRVYYFCGGSWQIPPSPPHWRLLREMASTLHNTIITVLSPPLAPASPAAVTMPQLHKLYLKLLEDSKAAGETVVMGGDSSGGNLALCVVLERLLKEGAESKPCADAILAISPSVNLVPFPAEEKRYKITHGKDPILSIKTHNQEVKQWTGELDPSEAGLSPLSAEVDVLARAGVKLFGVTGSHDILSPDAISFREKCVVAGVEGEWLHWEGQMHVFPMAFHFGLRESKEGKNWIIDMLKSLGG